MTHVSPARFHAAHEATASAVVPGLHIIIPPAPEMRAVVVIPVKDEADNLPQTLAALAAQLDLCGQPLSPRFFEVIVLANNCQDHSAAVARRFAQLHPALPIHVVEITLPPTEAHIGRARRLLMDEACRRLELITSADGFIASTDGDTRVAADWLAATHAELTAHRAAAVCGRILTPARDKQCVVRRYHLRDASYRLLRARLEAELDPNSADPWPRHHQHFGASFAITAVAYRRVGGLPVVPYLEDEALYRALQRHDLRVRHSPAVRVFTSDRHEGRVAVGLSWQLREWAALGAKQQEPLVASTPSLVATLTARRQLRRLWQQAQLTGAADVISDEQNRALGQLADFLGVSAVPLSLQLRQAAFFGELWEWAEQEPLANAAWTQRWCPVPLSQGLHELRQELAASARMVF
ncbi:glycosyltransferase [Hymenobacter elongatus]|uniref:Glycosyltransferase n=1 Tax=Hymenobacter elongatus TaxID=877208 RepID=A0A4Z0PMH9_9BACT|nr:glycosyltransferase [Hymenobacter elongatus]TGE17018.1 glycosyltransferase [Hymenobacter elongatus]